MSQYGKYGALRKRQQRAIDKVFCMRCGRRDNLQIHHPNIKDEPECVVVWCDKCQQEHHINTHSWGKQNDTYRKTA